MEVHILRGTSFTGVSRKGLPRLVTRTVLAMMLLIGGFNAYSEGTPNAPKALTGCPANTFEGFLATYTEDTELQKKHTKLPLPFMITEDVRGKPEPVPAEQTLTRFEDIKIRLMGNKAKSKKDGIMLSRIEEDPISRQKIAVYAKDDTGILIKYFFQKKEGCWILNRIENWST